MKIAVCLLAKDEGAAMYATLAAVARQTFLDRDGAEVEVHVVSNGSSDNSVSEAERARPLFEQRKAQLHVHDIAQAGKSRAWNRAVHELADPTTDVFVFIDADISFVDHQVIAELLDKLAETAECEVVSGYPVKDIAQKERKSVLDLFSLSMSRRTRHVDVVNGSLYVARGSSLRRIWLPNETPGEDGFLNAMVKTNGFSEEPRAERVSEAARPTHYFEAHSPLQFVAHEKRLIVGTIINCWVFEHLWALEATSPVGPLIGEWNEAEPAWVERIIRERSAGRRWLVSNQILFGRFRQSGDRTLLRRLVHLPLAVAGTLATLPAAVGANRRVRQAGAASHW